MDQVDIAVGGWHATIFPAFIIAVAVAAAAVVVLAFAAWKLFSAR